MAQPRFGSFIPTTSVWDVSQIYETNLDDKEALRELLVRLYQNLNSMAINTNIKDIGYYDTNEQVNGQLLFPNPDNNSTTQNDPTYRGVFRKVINFGTLPNTATISVPHEIEFNDTMSFTRIYGTATDPVALEAIPIPYTSTMAASQNVELWVDATNVNIDTNADFSAYTICYVVLEYVKN